MNKIPISKPYLGPEEMEAVQKPLETGWVVQGPYVKKFEDAFSKYTKSLFSAASTSCTTALHLSVAALDLKPGQEVIVPAFTWVSTANVVEYMGAKPVFCDVDLQTFNIDPEKAAELINEKTVGMIPVHLFGLCADMEPLLQLCREHKLWMVEDAACAAGAWYNGKHAGTFGEFGCFSFHPRKSITTGEGGMVTTQDSELDRVVRALRDHGASRTDLDRHTSKQGFLLPEYKYLGYNYRMTDIQGAVGEIQMSRFPWILSERRKQAQFYDEALKEIPWITTPQTPAGYEHGYQAYVCHFRLDEAAYENAEALGAERNKLMSALEDSGIATRQGTHAPVTQTYYKDKYQIQVQDFPNSVLAEQISLALPLFPSLSEEDQQRVVDSLKKFGPQ